MRRKDREVTDFDTIVGIIDECEIVRIGIADGDARQDAIDNIIMARHEETKNFVYNKETVQRTAVAKLSVIEISAKVNPIKGGADV